MKKKRLEPLWNELVNKTDAFITALEESDEDKSDLIEDTKMVLEFIEQKMATISCARNRNREKISNMDGDRTTVENPWRINKVPHDTISKVANLYTLKLPEVVE